MRLKKWYIGMLSALLLLCLAVFPAMATEADANDGAETCSVEESIDDVVTEAENVAETEADTLLDESDDVIDTEEEKVSLEIKLDSETLSLQYIDVVGTLKATVTDKNSLTDVTGEYTVKWSSSNESVATVEDGQVTACADGTATITAGVYSNESDETPLASAECAVTVKLYSGIRKDVTGATNTVYYYKDGEVYSSDEGKATVQKDSDNVVDKTTVYWWYVDSDGKVDVNKTYTGYAENQNGWWYIENGIVTFKKNSVIKDKNINGESVIDGNASWWYVTGSKVRTDFTGLADYSNENGWWYIENGKVTFTKNTVAKNKNGWWYVTGSKVQFGFTGLANYSNENGWWYIKNGKVDFTKNTVAKNKNGWYYVTGGKVQFGYTGVANYKNENGWWYIKGGKVDFTFNGVSSNKNGSWYCQNGKVTFNATGIVSTSSGAWYVEGSKVKSISGTLKVSNGNVYLYNGSTKVTGWKAIGSGYYYFDRTTGVLKKNTTVDGVKLGTYGKATTTTYSKEMIKTMIKARAVYLSIVDTSASKSTQLKTCFDWVLKHPYKRYRILAVARSSSTWICTYANDEFDSGNGCCVSEACCFSFLAYECGYTPYICDDTGHAWTEIDGKVYDTLFAEAKSYSKYYGSSYSTAGLYRVNKTFLY